MPDQFIISAIVEHKPGVLFRVSNMFRRRNFNIESISIGPTEQPDLARMTMTMVGNESDADQVVKQLGKLIDVVKANVLDSRSSVVRELALVKIDASDSKTRTDIFNYVNAFRGKIIDVSPQTVTVEIVGTTDKVDAFIDLSKAFGVKEVARSGVTALIRGPQAVMVDA